jgi:hypothetical protein
MTKNSVRPNNSSSGFPRNYVKPHPNMKTINLMKAVTLLTFCITSIALADDFETVNGKEYKNAMVRRIEPDGVVLITKVGISKVYFVELPKEVQQRFHYDPVRAAGFNVTVQATVAQSNANAQLEAAAKEKAAKAQLAKAQREAQARQAAEALAPHPVSSMQSVGGGGEQSQIP